MHRLGVEKGGSKPATEPVEKLAFQPPARPAFGRRPFMEAGFDHCRFPLWKDGDTHRDICGERTVSVKSSWCSHHFNIVSEPTKARRFRP